MRVKKKYKASTRVEAEYTSVHEVTTITIRGVYIFFSFKSV